MAGEIIKIDSPADLLAIPPGGQQQRQFSYIDAMLFVVGAAGLLWGLWKLYWDLNAAHFPQTDIWQTMAVQAIVGGFLVPANFPSNEYHTWARKRLAPVFGMTNIQAFVLFSAVGMYGFRLYLARKTFDKYEGIDLVQGWIVANINVVGLSVIPGLLMVRMPDWQARKAYVRAQEIREGDLYLDEKEFQLDAKKRLLEMVERVVESERASNRAIAVAVNLIKHFLPPADAAANTSSSEDTKLLMEMMNQQPKRLTGRPRPRYED